MTSAGTASPFSLPTLAPVALPLVLLALILALGGCGSIRTAVPVYGDDAALTAMAGEWRGEYTSREANRHGTIFFTLAAHADSAVGEVIMKPGERDEDVFDRPDPSVGMESTLLTIRFVRVGGDHVVGQLNEYRDPVCGCLLHTTFDGHLEGDRIEGVYITHGEGMHHDTTGQWWVTRVGP